MTKEKASTPPKKRPPRKRRPPIDCEWQREQAMQAGMGLGIDAYNEAMGWEASGYDSDE